jgi:hypothetical protein
LKHYYNRTIIPMLDKKASVMLRSTHLIEQQQAFIELKLRLCDRVTPEIEALDRN